MDVILCNKNCEKVLKGKSGRKKMRGKPRKTWLQQIEVIGREKRNKTSNGSNGTSTLWWGKTKEKKMKKFFETIFTL